SHKSRNFQSKSPPGPVRVHSGSRSTSPHVQLHDLENADSPRMGFQSEDSLDEPLWGSQPRLKSQPREDKHQWGSKSHLNSDCDDDNDFSDSLEGDPADFNQESDPGVQEGDRGDGSESDEAEHGELDDNERLNEERGYDGELDDNEQPNEEGGDDGELAHDEPMDAHFEDDIIDGDHREGLAYDPMHNVKILDIPGCGITVGLEALSGFDEHSSNEGYDVLDRHHVKNRRPRPPSPRFLEDVRKSEPAPVAIPRLKNKRARKTSKSVSTAVGSSGSEPEPPKRKRGKFSVTPKDRIALDPTKIGFYPSLWKDFIEKCKVDMRLHASTVDPFPTLPTAVDEVAVEILMTTLAMYKEQKRSLERDIWPEHKMHMARMVSLQAYSAIATDDLTQLYDDLFTFRSELKKFIGPIVVANYPLFPNRPLASADEHKAFVRKAAKLELKQGKYLRGEPDEEGRTSNFAANALKEGCAFFYRGGLYALVLVALAVKCVVRGFADHGCEKSPDFNVNIYGPEARRMKTLVDTVLADPYHGPKLEQRLRDWALFGLHGTDGVDSDFDSDNDGDAILLD
ncbi:hypothetical protein BV22DRAFT_1052658, partial [Leucogyrophana mollusca]